MERMEAFVRKVPGSDAGLNPEIMIQRSKSEGKKLKRPISTHL